MVFAHLEVIENPVCTTTAAIIREVMPNQLFTSKFATDSQLDLELDFD